LACSPDPRLFYPARAICATRGLTLAVLVLLWLLPGSASASRHRPGPVTIRGTVTAVGHHSFQFVSPSKGGYTALLSKLTSYWEHHVVLKHRHITVGTHVGVRGYLSHRKMTAIRVTVYPSKRSTPKESTLRGTVVKTGSRWIDVMLGKKRYHFVLARGAKVIYRLNPVRLKQAKPHERVDVRWYRSAKTLVATHVLLLVIQVHHPRSHFEHGLVIRRIRGGFELETVAGARMRVSYPGHVSVGEIVSVRGYMAGGLFRALRVRAVKHLSVHTVLVRGIAVRVSGGSLVVRIGSALTTFVLLSGTRISSGSFPVSARALKPGKYVSVRYWLLGRSRVASSIHIYAHIPVPRATGAVKGTVLRIHGGVLVVRDGAKQVAVRLVAAVTRVRQGSHRATVRSLRRGLLVSVRYYGSAHRLTATSIHIFTGGHAHTFTGTILRISGTTVSVLDRGVRRTVVRSRSTVVRIAGRTVAASSLLVGDKVRVEATKANGRYIATRIDILPAKQTKTGGSASSFRGTVAVVHRGYLILTIAGGSSLRIDRGSRSRLVVRGVSVPESWLFAGPTASVAVAPRHRSPPLATTIDFHPSSRTVSGDVLAKHRRTIVVSQRRGDRQTVALDVARVTDEGRRAHESAIQVGIYVHVTGFRLGGGAEAALTVAVLHPTIRVSGEVVADRGSRLTISRTSGQMVSLAFPRHVDALSTKTGQWFPAWRIPSRSHLSVRGVQEAGWVRVGSARLLLRSRLDHGVVTALGATTFRMSALGTRTVVHAGRLTKITEGRNPVSFGSIEVADAVSVRSYADVRGGLLAHSVDIQRKSTTRTGFVSNLSNDSFDLLLRDGTRRHVNIRSWTVLLHNGSQIAMSNLADGDKVKVSGHLRPDGQVDATKIDLEAA